MQYSFFRQKNAGHHVYVIKDYLLWHAISKVTFSGLLCGELSLYCNEEEILLLQQKSILKQLIMNFPFVRLFFFNPYTIFKNKRAVGQVRRIHHGFSFNINDDIFELRLHSGFILSLTQNDHQLAVFSRIADGEYLVKCNESGNAHVGILLLCCAFFDEGYMVNRGSIQRNIIANDSYSERATWVP